MFKTMKNVISVLFSLVKFTFVKFFRFKRFHFYLIERFSPATMINIWPDGILKLGKKVSAHSGTKLSVTREGMLCIGDRVAFNYNCIVTCRKKIMIGRDTTLGPGVLIYDHDHDFRSCEKKNSNVFKMEDVVIGENCWIGANTVILRGTKIGDNCVVGAGCVLKGEFPANSVIVQKRETFVKSF